PATPSLRSAALPTRGRRWSSATLVYSETASPASSWGKGGCHALVALARSWRGRGDCRKALPVRACRASPSALPLRQGVAIVTCLNLRCAGNMRASRPAFSYGRRKVFMSGGWLLSRSRFFLPCALALVLAFAALRAQTPGGYNEVEVKRQPNIQDK